MTEKKYHINHPEVLYLCRESGISKFTAIAYLTGIEMEISFLEMPYYLNEFHSAMKNGATYENAIAHSLYYIIMAPLTIKSIILDSFCKN